MLKLVWFFFQPQKVEQQNLILNEGVHQGQVQRENTQAEAKILVPNLAKLIRLMSVTKIRTRMTMLKTN